MSYKEDIKFVASLPLPWEKLSGSNILVTGATGLIGSCLVEVLMSRPEKDYQVFVSGRNEERARKRFASYEQDSAFHFFKYDVLSPLEGDINFDFIVHAASNASPNFFVQKPVEVIRANVDGVHNLLSYGLRHHLKRFLYVSSGEVYGEGDGSVFSEEYSGYVDCTKPRSCYPSSKRAAETLCAAYMAEYGVDMVIARPSHTYGPYFTESDNRVFAQFVRNVLRNEDIIMKSTGSQFRSWCYVVDCVSAMLHILFNGERGEAYNIADQTSNITIKEFATMVATSAKKNVIMEIPSDAEKAGFNIVTKSIFSTAKLESLGWQLLNGDMNRKVTSMIEECKQIQ